MSVTVFRTWNARCSIGGVSDKKRFAKFTPVTLSVIMTLDTVIQFVRPFAVGMAVTKTLNRTISPHITEFTFTFRRCHTATPNTSLRTDGFTSGTSQLIALATHALVAVVQVYADFGTVRAAVVTVGAFIFFRACHVMPRVILIVNEIFQ